MIKVIMTDDAFLMVFHTMELTLDREEELQSMVNPSDAHDVAAFAASVASLKTVMEELAKAAEAALKRERDLMVIDKKMRDLCPYLGIDSKGRWYVMTCGGDTFPIEFVENEEAGKKRIAELRLPNAELSDRHE